MCPLTSCDAVQRILIAGCADLLYGLVFPVVVIKQRRRQRPQACRSDYQRAHHLAAIAADCFLLRCRNLAARGTPKVSGACSSPPFVALGGRACIALGLPMFGVKRPRHKSTGSSAHDPLRTKRGRGTTPRFASPGRTRLPRCELDQSVCQRDVGTHQPCGGRREIHWGTDL
jgi:hypothetical protein